MNIFREKLYPDHGQYLEIKSVLHRGWTDYQEVLVFENPTFGKVFVLDGVVQLTQRDNHIYHEMLTHVPMMAHGGARNVLIVGGGDGGTLREVLKHPVDAVTLVELDPEVVAVSRKFLPEISQGAFEDPRVSLVHGDGADYIKNSERRFDVVIVDSTDPIGPGGRLFTAAFYDDARRTVREKGLICVQSGCPFYRSGDVEAALAQLRKGLGAAKAFLAPVPTYANGLLALMVAGQEDCFVPESATLRARTEKICLETRYYSPEVHHAAFAAVPRFADDWNEGPHEEAAIAPLPDWLARSADRQKVVLP